MPTPPQPQSDLSPSSNKPAPKIQNAPPNAEKLHFTLQDLTVDGNTVFDSEALSDLWLSLVGQDISVATLFDIANAITRRYAAAGYVLSFAVVPQQAIADGRVHLHIIEGFVDAIDFTGDKLSSVMDGGVASETAKVRAMAEQILRSRPLRNTDLERYLLLLNDIPGMTAHATFSPSPGTPDASRMTIDIERTMATATAHLDDHLAYYLSRWSSNVSATLNGLMNGTDSLTIQKSCGIFCNVYNTSLINWSTLAGSDGLRLTASIVKSYDEPVEGTLQSIAFRGRQTSINLSADYPLMRTRAASLRVGTLWQGSNAVTEALGSPLTRDQVRSMDLHTDYDIADSMGGHNLLHAAVTQGLPVLGATTYDDPLKSKAYGDSTYSILKMDIARLQPLQVLDPSLDAYTLYLAGSSQIDMAHPLLSATQCSYGGAVYGRGYDNGAISGDHCAMGLTEIRRNFGNDEEIWQAYTSFDIGGAWQKGPLIVNEPRFLGAESVAIGMRMTYVNWLNSDLQLALPLRDSASEKALGHPRLFYTLDLQF